MNLEDAGEQKANISQETYDLCMDKLKEVYKIAVIMDYQTQFTELESSLPALAIAVENSNITYNEQIVVVTFLPLDMRNYFHLVAQFTVVAVDDMPEDKLNEIKKVLDFYNSSFSLSTYIIMGNALTTKYAMYVDHEDDINQIVFAKTLEMLAVEASDIAAEVQDIIDGEKTAEEIINIALARDVSVKSDDNDDDEDDE